MRWPMWLLPTGGKQARCARRWSGCAPAAIAAALGISLAGCASPGKFATVDAFCDALPKQAVAIKGATAFDQPWIDETSEAVIAGCNRDRPAARPPEWDRPLAAPASPGRPKSKLRRALDQIRS